MAESRLVGSQIPFRGSQIPFRGSQIPFRGSQIPFRGFPPGKVRQARLPDVFFTEVLPAIDDLAELKVTLHVLWRLQREASDPPVLSHAALASDGMLLTGLAGLADTPAAALERGLARAVERGTLLRVQVGDGADAATWYLANTPRGREAWAQAQRGELILAGSPAWAEPTPAAERPNIFTLYEQNIGLLTPLIAEELQEAEDTYPAHWIEDAFREAVRANKRNWRYVAAVLKRWASGGRGGIARGDSKEELEQYYRGGKYGHLIRH